SNTGRVELTGASPSAPRSSYRQVRIRATSGPRGESLAILLCQSVNFLARLRWQQARVARLNSFADFDAEVIAHRRRRSVADPPRRPPCAELGSGGQRYEERCEAWSSHWVGDRAGGGSDLLPEKCRGSAHSDKCCAVSAKRSRTIAAH